jgi:hypothetical protein
MSKGTTKRNIRVSDEIWNAALVRAEKHDTTVSEVVRSLLVAWLQETS